MKNRIAKISALICVMALVLTAMLALSACGDSGTKYTYSGVNITTDEDLGVDMSYMNTLYDTMYKDSFIIVTDSEIKWTISDAESTMTVKKDGDKYNLSGEYVEQMKTALSSGAGITGADISISFDMYGQETENGFDIIMNSSSSTSVSGTTYTYSIEVTVSFVK